MRLKNLVYSLGLALVIAGILVGFISAHPSAHADAIKTSTTANVSHTKTSFPVVSVGQVPSQQAVGSTDTVLTTTGGFTLYVHEWKGTSSFTCNNTCAKSWKPLIYTGAGMPTSTTPLPGKLSFRIDAQGRKAVFYQGYPLYTYGGDTKPGDYNAHEADDSPWQACNPNIKTGL